MEEVILDQLQALGHPRRLAVFRLLMRRYPDALPAGEIRDVLGVPASSLSAGLAQLRAAGLIAVQRQGTSLLYCAETAGAGALMSYLVADCCRGRPAACLPQSLAAPVRVLFVCSGNATRSICAEAQLRSRGAGRFDVRSAGLRPKDVANGDMLRLLRGRGHSVDALEPAPLSRFQAEAAQPMDVVLTVCDRAANAEAGAFPGQPLCSHWGIPPLQGPDGLARIYEMLSPRIEALAAMDFDTTDRAGLQAGLDEIAQKRG